MPSILQPHATFVLCKKGNKLVAAMIATISLTIMTVTLTNVNERE